jgi:hypothetical protein
VLANCFYQLLNVHNTSGVMQIEIHTAEPLVPGPSHLEIEIAIAKLEKYKSPGNDEVSAELIQARGETLVSAVHKLTNSIWNKEEVPEQWKDCYFTSSQKREIKLTVIIIVGYNCYQFHIIFYQTSISQG